MPENNMDVKYKEFSGMVGGRGDGMEDNVYMPIVEGESRTTSGNTSSKS